ncbi:hypothetical protein [Bradyrhizobium sp. BR 1433]|uniref:hypothetical protein n=1 Tax=Bradyrhizobium sp. BR 1433 TaxID=3447967 RepID=UPI003EE79862
MSAAKTKAAQQPEPEHFQPAWTAYPGHQIMRRDLGLNAFRALTPAKQKLCRAAAPEYAMACSRWKRSR